MSEDWPELDYLGWRDTCSALHLYLQVAGRYRLAHAPWINHGWNAAFQVTPRGLTSALIPDGPGIEIRFDFLDHEVRGFGGDGGRASFPLGPSTVAAFQAGFDALISELGGTPVTGDPANPTPFGEDDRDRPYDRDAVLRFHQASLAVVRVLDAFRSSYVGKASPAHLLWGDFDLATSRYSGRRAPTGQARGEADDHEVWTAGFRPGGGGADYPAFHAGVWPEPPGFRAASVSPEHAFRDEARSAFILPYDAVRSAADPDAALMAFLVSTYEAAADLGGWDRALLDRDPGGRAAARPLPAPDAAASGAVEREDSPSKGRYRLVINGVEAEMTYSRAGERLIIIDHTEVPAALRGRKVGERLVGQAVEDARRDGVAIVPLCPFAKALIGRHPEWQDVLAQP